jgi:hypothetical protein
LAIELVDEDGQPAAGARYIVSRGGEVIREGVLDEQGQARLKELEPGTYMFTFPDFDAGDWGPVEPPPTKEGPSPEPEPAAPAEPVEGPPEVTAKTAWLAIELLDEDDQAAGRAKYIVSRGGEVISEGVLDERGQARLEELEPGTYTFTFPDFAAGDWGPAEPPSVEEGPPSEPEPEAPSKPAEGPPEVAAKTAWLAIELVDEDGQPVVRAKYVVSRDGEVVGEGVLDEQGQARLEKLETGSYTLIFPDLDAEDWQISLT